MFNVGPAELIVILLVALIIFGPKRLPEIGKTVGKGLREFRKATQDIRSDVEGAMSDDGTKPAAPSVEAQRMAAQREGDRVERQQEVPEVHLAAEDRDRARVVAWSEDDGRAVPRA